MRRALIPTALLALTALAACGGGESASTATPAAGSSTAPSTKATTPPGDAPASTPAGAPTTPPAAPSSTPSTSAAATTPATTPASAPDLAGFEDDFDICASVPPLDVINTQLTQPATQLVELERGPGFAICEANGGEVDNVQFQRITDVTRELSIELATELGATVTDLSDPAGGFAYSGAAAVVIDGVEWTVQTITWDTIGDPDSPAAIERSASLLRAWLVQMGVTP